MNCLKKESNITSKSPLTLSGDFLETLLKIRGARGDILKILLPILLFFIWYGEASAASLSKAPNNLGLVGYWSFDEGRGTVVGDRSGLGNHGTIAGTPVWAKGKYGGALNFDGGSDLVNVGSNSIFDLTSDLTISAWVKLDVIDGSDVVVARSDGGWALNSPERGYILMCRAITTNLWCMYNISGSSSHWGSSTNIGPIVDRVGKWIHLTGTTNGTTHTLYANGVVVGSATVDTGDRAVSANLVMGDDNTGSDDMHGTIDEVRIYNRALTAAQVKSLYESGKVKVGASSADLDNGTSLENGLVGHWTMDGGDTNWSSNTMTDRSGQGNTGTMTNMSTTSSPTIGKIGQALSFNGSNTLITTPLVLSNSSPFTFSAWVKFATDGVVDGKEIFSQDSTGNDDISLIYSDGGGFSYESETDAHSADQFTGFGPLDLDNNWHHIVVVEKYTSDVDDNDYYVDGVEVATFSHAGGGNPGNTTFVIGNRGAANNAWSGSLDDVRVYNRALSASEIKQLYNLGQNKINTNQNKTGGSLDSGLVGLWSFNGPDISWGSNTAYDRSGQGNNGTITNMSTTTSPTIGKIGQALRFDGVSGRVDLGTPSSLNITGEVTVSAWINYRTASLHETIVAHADSAAATNGWQYMLFMGGTNSINFRVGNGTSPLISAASLLPNTWYHVVGKYNGTDTTTLYVDGVQVDSDTSVGFGALLSLPTQKVGIGAAVQNNRGYFDGFIDEVRIYNRVLSADEILQLYRMGR